MGIVIKDGVRYREKDVDRFAPPTGRITVKPASTKVDEPEVVENVGDGTSQESTEETDEASTKVDEPEVTKERTPSTTKRTRASK